jgi:hypothetical protein
MCADDRVQERIRAEAELTKLRLIVESVRERRGEPCL